MGLIARTRDLFARRGESRPSGVIARIVPRWLENRPLPQKSNTRKLLDEGYRKHSIIHVCFPAGTEVATPDRGVVPIEEVQVGESVVSHTGETRDVTARMERDYEGDFIEFRRAAYNRKVTSTAEHPFFVARRPSFNEWFCLHGRGGRKARDLDALRPEWLPASEIGKGDFFVEPIRSTVKPIETPPGYGRLLGYFLAEGYRTDATINFAFHGEETDYIADVEALMRSCFGLHMHVYASMAEASGNGTVVSFHSTALARQLSEFGRGARNKRLPLWVLEAPAEFQSEMLLAFWRGDGCRRPDGFALDTASRELAEGLRIMSLRLGMVPSLSSRTHDVRLPGGTLYRRTLHRLNYTGGHGRRFGELVGEPSGARSDRTQAFIHNGCAFYPVHEARRFAAKGKVYNLSVRTDESYVANGVSAHNCIRELAQTAAEPVPRIMRNGVFLDDHPALALLETPNPLQTGFEFVELLITYLQSVGNAYVHKVRSARGRVVELWLLRPDRTRIVPGPDGMVARYEFRIDGEATGVSVPPEDVVHFRLPDVLDDYYGLPPVAVAAQIADLDTNAIDYLRAFFLNSGTPAGILKFKIRVDKPDRERVKEEWIEQHTGLAGWHSISVLDADAEYQPIGANVKEANVDHIFDITESRLPAIWGVPPIIVGMRLGLLRSTFANYKEARTSFWGETARPMYRRLQGKLTAGVVREFDERGKLVFDLSDVEALQESIDSRRTFAIDGWREGLLDRKQSLEIVGMEAEPSDEGLFVTDALMTMAGGEPIEVLGSRSTPIEVEATSAPRQIPGPRQAHDDAPEPPWTALHRVADQGALAVRRTFLRAVATAVNGTVLRKVEAALRAKDYAGAEAAIPWESTAVRTLEAEIPEELRTIVVKAGVAAEKVQPRTLDFGFNVSDPVSVEWAAARSSELVTEVTTVTRQAIRDAVARAIDEGRGARVAAREIRDVIGLTRRQEQSIENLRARLVAENLAADKIQEKLRKARQKLVRRRALLISRTESMSAANFGQQRLWEQALEQGLIDQEMFREFVTTPDDRLCPFCAPMDGQRVRIDEPFTSGAVPRKNGNAVQLPPVPTPPLHPACRCVMRLIVD